MTRYRWQYNAEDRVWELWVAGREIYNVGSRWQPAQDETVGILMRLVRFYPWLADMGREAA